MPTDGALDVIFGFLFLAALPIAAWLAQAIMPAFDAQLAVALPQVQLRSSWRRLIAWLALSGLVSFPLEDVLRVLKSLPSILMPEATPTMARTSTVWGTAPWSLYLVLLDLFMVGAYSLTFALWWPVTRPPRPSSSESRQSRFCAVLLIAGLGSLVARFFEAVAVNILYLPLGVPIGGVDRGIVGFLAAWALSLMFLGVVIVLMRGRINAEEDEGAAV